MHALLRDGLGTTVSAGIASAFYAGPLVLMVLAGSGGARERASVALPPIEGERVAVFLPDLPEGIDEEDLLEPVLAEVDEPTEAVVVTRSDPGPAEIEAEPGGVAGEASGTADVGGEGEGTGAGDGEGAGKGQKARAKPKRNRRNTGCNAPHPNIRKGDDGVLEVDRLIVDRYTKNLETFMRLGYSRPHDEDGYKGWYISGFSCVSVVHKAGFRRGDVLLAVNGKKTRSWIGVFMMYQKLKNKEDFEVQLVRKGEPMTLRFRVVEG
jgi:hypothetical protein